ncbi:MAG: hypothetical protein U0Z44_09770 [Kouleothrix sp.]
MPPVPGRVIQAGGKRRVLGAERVVRQLCAHLAEVRLASSSVSPGGRSGD